MRCNKARYRYRITQEEEEEEEEQHETQWLDNMSILFSVSNSNVTVNLSLAI